MKVEQTSRRRIECGRFPYLCGTMATDFASLGLPIPEQVLHDLSKSIVQVIPKFSEQERDSGVK
jgi:hypothetical protein